jgi:inhibitor of growth protein 3
MDLKRTDRAPSPSESIVSVTSHILPPPVQHNAGGSRGAGSATGSRGNGSVSAPVNKRARPSANSNRVVTPQPNENYGSPHEMGPSHPTNNGHIAPSVNSRRDAFNVPPSSIHPSLPLPYQPPNGVTNGHRSHSSAPYDIHTMPQPLGISPDWNPPLTQQLEGPGMPVARGQSMHPVLPIIPVVPMGAVIPAEGAEAADGDGDGDDRTYCFCDGVSYGEMIACDDSQCEREWVRPFSYHPSRHSLLTPNVPPQFHLACIGLTVPPDGRWFCETCRNKRNAKRAGRGGKRRAAGNRAGGRAG